ncbi:serine/threonine-protein kinase [Nocardia carnea]|uniref:serine/threonine-protein kinase n=1 Tax=Nocardia carnea TaxID=37328 RepID=UPI0024545AE9|nr:serine/threonine-protein kinase [Nocardia carnea]
MIELRAGVVFAGYTIEHRIGAGGWGVVYAARDPRLPRSVALKLLDPDRAGDEARRRFEREAELTAGLEHPDIVTIYDRGIEGGVPWIAMQYVPGTDASALRDIEPARALKIGARVAAALDYAHSAGVLHRDVKPSNILIAPAELGRPEQVLLGDFGIARLRDAASRLTRTGSVTGTAAYVSPEQVSGGEVDHRSDQYSLACSLFVLLTGRPPFTVTDSLALLHAHVYTPPVLPGDVLPELAALDEVFAKALAKQPADRYRSCSEFTDAALATLASVAITRTSEQTELRTRRPAGDPESPPRTRYRKRALLTGAVALLPALAIAGWLIVGSEPAGGDPATEAASAPADSALGWDERHRPAAEAFPGLIGAKNTGNGWRGAFCTENDPGNLENAAYRDNARISCRVTMNDATDPLVFDILDRSGSANAHLPTGELVDALFEGCEPSVIDIEHPSGTRLPVATCEGVTYNNEIDTSDHRIYVWTFFPHEERSRYIMVARWSGHTVQELIDHWWKQAPLGG